MRHFPSEEGKRLQAADRSEAATDAEIPPELKERFAAVIGVFKEKVPEVSDVRLTKRLTESASCLVADAEAMSAHMERIMERFGRGEGGSKRILELNPDNAAVTALRDLHANNASDPRLETYVRLLYEQAVIAEGSKVLDPSSFAKRINELIARDGKA